MPTFKSNAQAGIPYVPKSIPAVRAFFHSSIIPPLPIDQITAFLAITEDDDAISATADVSIDTTLAATEADDALTSNAAVLIEATLSVTEASDTLAGTASLVVGASLSVTDDNDALSAIITVLVGAALAVTEANDAIAATSTVSVGVTLAVTEASDTASSTATVLIGASLASTEADDSLTASSTIDIDAILALVEASDSLVATAQLGADEIDAVLIVTEAADRLAATIFVKDQFNPPLHVNRCDYFFVFPNEYSARSDPIVGPYFNSLNENMLLNLIVLDLSSGIIPGWWCMVTQPNVFLESLGNSKNCKLILSFPGNNYLGSSVIKQVIDGKSGNIQILVPGGGPYPLMIH